jgi:hypothetical protein
MNWFSYHSRAHPKWVFSICLAAVLSGFVVAALSLNIAFSTTSSDSHRAAVAICRSVNELRREVYVTLADAGLSAPIRDRILPIEDCEKLP